MSCDPIPSTLPGLEIYRVQLRKNVADENIDFGPERNPVGIVRQPHGPAVKLSVRLERVTLFGIDAMESDIELEGVAGGSANRDFFRAERFHFNKERRVARKNNCGDGFPGGQRFAADEEHPSRGTF